MLASSKYRTFSDIFTLEENILSPLINFLDISEKFLRQKDMKGKPILFLMNTGREVFWIESRRKDKSQEKKINIYIANLSPSSRTSCGELALFCVFLTKMSLIVCKHNVERVQPTSLLSST